MTPNGFRILVQAITILFMVALLVLTSAFAILMMKEALR